MKRGVEPKFCRPRGNRYEALPFELTTSHYTRHTYLSGITLERLEGTNGHGAAISSSESIQRIGWAVWTTEIAITPPMTQPPPARRSHEPPHLCPMPSLSPCLLKRCAKPTWKERWRVWSSRTWVVCRMPHLSSTNPGRLRWYIQMCPVLVWDPKPWFNVLTHHPSIRHALQHLRISMSGFPVFNHEICYV